MLYISFKSFDRFSETWLTGLLLPHLLCLWIPWKNKNGTQGERKTKRLAFFLFSFFFLFSGRVALFCWKNNGGGDYRLRLLKRDNLIKGEREACLVLKLITFHTSRKERDTFSLTCMCTFAFLNHLPTLFSQQLFGFAIISKSDFVLSIVCPIKVPISHYLYTLLK